MGRFRPVRWGSILQKGGLCSFALASYLFVNLGELLKIVLKKGNFLFLRRAAPSVVRVHLCTLQQADRRVRDFCRLLVSTKSDIQTVICLMIFTFFTLVAKSWTKSFLRLCRVCSSLALRTKEKNGITGSQRRAEGNSSCS